MDRMRWLLLPAVCGILLSNPAYAVFQDENQAATEQTEKKPVNLAATIRKINTSTADEAAAMVEELIVGDPQQTALQLLRLNVIQRAALSGKNEIALAQSELLTDYLFSNLDDRNVRMRLASTTSTLAGFLSRMGQADRGNALIGRAVAAMDEILDATPEPALLQSTVQLTSLQASQLTVAGDPDGAFAVIESRREKLQKFLESPETAEVANQALARLMQTELSVVSRFKPAELDQLVAKQKEFLLKLLKEKPLSPQMLSEYATARYAYIGRIARDTPEKAEEVLNETLALLAQPEFSENSQLDSAITRLKNLERMIASALMVKRMIGQPAPPFDIAAWAHGPSANPESLKGKVVLLDFWAVWCGPCIATFPHLKQLHEEFHDQGLEIVGVTRQYNYKWNDETSRPAKVDEEVTLEEELAMLDRFMSQHELPHATIVTPKASEMQKAYGVTGIPHAVLIDRQGNVRMIKVGSGQANAEALHDMVKQLIAE